MPLPPFPVGPFEPLSDAVRARSLADTIGDVGCDAPLWVFGYGALIWRPCFDPVTSTPARLDRYERSFCIWTALARGTPERPGLGLGLMPGPGRCEGVLLEVPRRGRAAALEALWAREMLTGIYRPVWVEVRAGRQRRAAIAFVVDPSHPQHAGELTNEERVSLIATATGELGSCREYLENTVAALDRAGLADPNIADMMRRVKAA